MWWLCNLEVVELCPSNVVTKLIFFDLQILDSKAYVLLCLTFTISHLQLLLPMHMLVLLEIIASPDKSCVIWGTEMKLLKHVLSQKTLYKWRETLILLRKGKRKRQRKEENWVEKSVKLNWVILIKTEKDILKNCINFAFSFMIPCAVGYCFKALNNQKENHFYWRRFSF